MTLACAGEPDRVYARRVTDEVRGPINQCAAPESIAVVGAGSGSPIVALTSAMTGNRHVNHVLLGNCDSRLADDTTFHVSGRMAGLRDADDSASLSCRPVWSRGGSVDVGTIRIGSNDGMQPGRVVIGSAN